MTDLALRSPLDDRHRALGARFGEFAGWQMPLEYAGGGVLTEHLAVREAVGIFDVSHLGKVRVSGAGAAGFVNRCLTNDLNRISAGQAQYTLCCDEATGGVVDDLIVYRYGDDHIFGIPNAANTAEIARLLSDRAPSGMTVTNEHREFAIIAVQGPRSAELLARLGLPYSHPYLSFVDTENLTVCRTGYTGEHGYELVVPVGAAGQLWDALLVHGAELGARPCGLGARDTLRTEMGYPLHGQDISLEISPVQARLGWAVGWSKPEFWGRAALLAEKERGPFRLAWGLLALDRGVPRPGFAVFSTGGEIGTVTSGTFSPTLRTGIALALLRADVPIAEGSDVIVDIRGRQLRMRAVKPPFVVASPK